MDNIIKRIASSKILLDVLIAFEDFLDNNDLYVFKNWFDGEIVSGPVISRYWVSVTLKYPYKKMPDPAGAERLIKNGCMIKYQKEHEEMYFKDISMTDSANISGLGFSPQTTLDKTPKVEHYIPVWLITITIPKRFVENIIEPDLVNFDGQIDLNDITDARRANIDTKTSFSNKDGNVEQSDEDLEL